MRPATREQSIVWEEDISRLPYVREIELPAGTRQRPVPWRNEGRRVGYAVLRKGAGADIPGSGLFTRRLFFLKDYDRDSDPTGIYQTGEPCEAIDPRQVRPGVDRWELCRQAREGREAA